VPLQKTNHAKKNRSMPPDRRKVVGEQVHALAHHVTSLSECNHRYGLLSKTKLVPGIVEQVDVVPNTNTNQSMTFIVVVYDLGGRVTKRAWTGIQSIIAGLTPPSPNPAGGLPP